MIGALTTHFPIIDFFSKLTPMLYMYTDVSDYPTANNVESDDQEIHVGIYVSVILVWSKPLVYINSVG